MHSTRPITRRISIVLAATTMVAAGQLEELTPQQLESIMKRLSVLEEATDSRVAARFRTAVQAFRGAMASDEAAFALYLNCVEKLDFTEKRRKAAEFREWREKNEERLKDSAFRRALRHQLRWLVLTLQAASENADPEQLAVAAGEIVDAIVADAMSLRGQQNVLNESVLGSYFARAYHINRVKAEEWPLAPGQIGQVYEQIFFPPLRERMRAEALRSQWTKRIQQEIRVAEVWEFGVRTTGGTGQALGPRSAEHETFMNEQVPQLQWEMEKDLFTHGDPAGAAMRMIAHLERHLGHPAAGDWLEELQGMLTVPDPADAENPLAPPEDGSVPPPAVPAPVGSVTQPAPQPVGGDDEGSVFIE